MKEHFYEVQWRALGKRNWTSTNTKYDDMADAVYSVAGTFWTHSVRILRHKKPVYKPKPLCRDCADNDGICPHGGTPCDPAKTKQGAGRVLWTAGPVLSKSKGFKTK